jgi:hypothetical protein
MTHKKTNFLVLCLFFLSFTATGCMKMITLKKESDTPPVFESLYIKKLKCENNILTIKNELLERRNGSVVRGWGPAASAFFYALYTAKNKVDFDNALMAKGEYFIPLYREEQINTCSALGIIAMNDHVLFTEKKEFTQKIIEKYQFKPTVADKEFIFFAKFKQFAPSIIQEIYYIRDINTELQIPQDIKDYIVELLFWLKCEEKESLL